MSDFNSSSLQIVHYEPGNPEFPTLPDGIDSLHIVFEGSMAGLQIEAPIENRFQTPAASPSNVDQRFHGWHVQDTWTKPATLALGVISQPLIRTVNIHNTRRTPITVNSVSVPSGITLNNPAPPVIVPPFESIVFTFDISADGPGTFDELITFGTTEGDIDVAVSGQRVDNFEFIPEFPLMESLAMKTELKRSKDGSEQAIALVKVPISQFDFNIAYDNDLDRIKLRNQIMAGSSQLLAGILKWPEARYLNAPAVATDTVIAVDTTNTSIANDDNVSFVTLDGRFVARSQVQSFTASSVTLNTQVGAVLPPNTIMVPFGYGYISRFPTFATYAVNREDTRIQFSINDETFLGATLPVGFPTLNGRPLLDKCNVLGGATKRGQANRTEDALNSQLLNRLAFSRFPLADELQEYRAILEGQAEIWQWRELFHYLNGSWGTFYVPSFRNDLPGVSTTASTDFSAPNIDLERLFGGASKEPRKYLRFEYPDGTIIYTSIVSVVDGATMVVADPLVVGDPVVSFVALARIVGDTATMRFESTLDEAEFIITYRTVSG